MDKCAYSVIQLHPRVCDSMFVSAHGLKCLLGVFITFSDLQRDSYFMSHLGQGRASWQSAGPPGRGSGVGGHRTSRQDLKQDILVSLAKHGE